MKRILLGLAVTGFILVLLSQAFLPAQVKKTSSSSPYQEGDIIFQSSNSKQCEAIKLATGSSISHCGMLFLSENQWCVLQAVEPVSICKLSEFIERGSGNKYSIKRVKKEIVELSPERISEMKKLGQDWINKHYDLQFNWSDHNMYCSELVWKLYKSIGVELCELRKLEDYDLSSPSVQ